MKTIYFYGCSFTAGDELSDDVWFPWKKDCLSADEYYPRRNKELGNNEYNWKNYHDDNYKLAYPARINCEEITAINRGQNGAGVGEIVFKIVKDYEENRLSDAAAIYMQLPTYPRELYLTTKTVMSIQFNGVAMSLEDKMNSYKLAKLRSHNFFQFASEDHMNIIFVKNFLENRNIPFYLVTFQNDLIIRHRDLSEDTNRHLKSLFNKEIKTVDLTYPLSKDANYKLLGGHFSDIGHDIIARELKHHIMSSE